MLTIESGVFSTQFELITSIFQCHNTIIKHIFQYAGQPRSGYVNVSFSLFIEHRPNIRLNWQIIERNSGFSLLPLIQSLYNCYPDGPQKVNGFITQL